MLDKIHFSSNAFQSVFLIPSNRSRLNRRRKKTRYTLIESDQSYYFRNCPRFQKVKEINLALNTQNSAPFWKFSSYETPGALVLDKSECLLCENRIKMSLLPNLS
jgi:hypothetical protein